MKVLLVFPFLILIIVCHAQQTEYFNSQYEPAKNKTPKSIPLQNEGPVLIIGGALISIAGIGILNSQDASGQSSSQPDNLKQLGIGLTVLGGLTLGCGIVMNISYQRKKVAFKKQL